MVRRSARLALKSGARLPIKGMLGSFSTEALSGRTSATLLRRKSSIARRRTDTLEGYTSSSGAWNRSSFLKNFQLGKGFVGTIIPVAVLLLLSWGVWSVFPKLPFQGLFTAAFTTAPKPTKNMTVAAL